MISTMKLIHHRTLVLLWILSNGAKKTNANATETKELVVDLRRSKAPGTVNIQGVTTMTPETTDYTCSGSTDLSYIWIYRLMNFYILIN